MADELDNFEAQLIAYLDGELSPADALALEQKLAAYPQHRRLMEEMRQQRELLLGLPSEAAPEALKAQLRAQVAQARPGGLSHRRLYRIAASILLMLGAGIVVHQLLPQRGTQAPQYATRMEPTAISMEPRDEEARARADERVESKIAARKTDAVPGVALAQSQQGRQQMFVNSNNISNSRTVISVASDNPTVMQAEIGRLLRDNRIAYSQEAEIPADTSLAAADTPARDAGGTQAPYAGKGQGPAPTRALEKQASVDAEKAKYSDKDANVDAKSAADTADQKLNQAIDKSEKAGKLAVSAAGAKESNAKPAAPALPSSPGMIAAAPNAAAPALPSSLGMIAAAPNAAAPVGLAKQAAGQRAATIHNSLPQQQVLVARNVSSGDVAQIEQALRDRQVGQQLKYRVTDTSNSQMASPSAANAAQPAPTAPATASISQINVVTTTQPAVAPATLPVQARGGPQTPAASHQPTAQQSPQAQQAQQAPQQQAEQTMDLLIVVEPETR